MPKIEFREFSLRELEDILAAADAAKINYRIRQYRDVERLRESMLAGMWTPNNCSVIRFNTNGQLIDGQHRVAAAIQAKKEQPGFRFETFVARDCQDTEIDTGKTRSFTDKLRHAGYVNTNEVATATDLIVHVYRGTLAGRTRNSTSSQSIKYSLVGKLPEIQDSVRRVYPLRSTVGNIGMLAGFHVVFSRIDEGKAEYLLEVLGEPGRTKDPDGCPAYVLYKSFLADRNANKKYEHYVKRAWVIKAWNALNANKKIKVVRLSENEAFPKVFGIARFLEFCKGRGADQELGLLNRSV